MDGKRTVLNDDGKNPVVVEVSEYQGVLRLDVRRYYYNAQGELLPTKKGVSLPSETGLEQEVLAAMQAAIAWWQRYA